MLTISGNYISKQMLSSTTRVYRTMQGEISPQPMETYVVPFSLKTTCLKYNIASPISTVA